MVEPPTNKGFHHRHPNQGRPEAMSDTTTLATTGAGPMPEQVAFWRPFTPAGRLVRRVLADMEHERSEALGGHHWRSNARRLIGGVPLRDILLSLASAVAIALFVAVFLLMAYKPVTFDPAARPTPAERCAAAGGTYTDLGGGLFAPSWSCEYPPPTP